MQSKVAFLFPGQGAKYVGMGRDFYHSFPEVRQTFEEAEELLSCKISSILFEGPEKALAETFFSQVGIYVVSFSIAGLLQKLFPSIKPFVCAGLSLGEYTALTASGKLPFSLGLPLVAKRARFMEEACKKTSGKMAAVLGIEGREVERILSSLPSPQEVWAANFNCPGQVVISGTERGMSMACEALKQAGAKKILFLEVQGAFHSPLMQEAQEKLEPYIQEVVLQESSVALVMNVPGNFVTSLEEIKQYMIQQVTCSVRWEEGISSMRKEGIERYIEIGCGRSLSSMNRKMDLGEVTLNVGSVSDLKEVEKHYAT